MDRWNRYIFLSAILAALLCGAFLIAQQSAERVTVTLCDGRTQMQVPGNLDKQGAQQVASLFLAEWRKRNPSVAWEMAAAAAPAQQSAAAPKAASQPKQAGIYSRFSPRDEFIWKTELDKFVKEGDRIFHDAQAFGGTIGVSCDMCHPNASNTHPETYPKYQVQLQKVALLRDMINWCIQNPTKGKPLADDDPRLRAMEAYIISQRAGKEIAPGVH